MSSSMTPDEKLWVDQGIAMYLRTRAFTDEIPALLVGRALAQLMDYWRCTVPPKWEFATGNTDYMTLAYSIAEHQTSPSQVALDCATYGTEVYEALEKSDWETMLNLPGPVWDWIAGFTALTREEWQALPDKVRDLVAAKIDCPNCASVFSLQDVGKPDEISDPYSQHSSRDVLIFTCPRCDHSMVFDSARHAMVEPSKVKDAVANVPMIVAFTILGLIVLVIIKSFLQ